jgi:hypothetical protein
VFVVKVYNYSIIGNFQKILNYQVEMIGRFKPIKLKKINFGLETKVTEAFRDNLKLSTKFHETTFYEQ